jgi:hypothetical protein
MRRGSRARILLSVGGGEGTHTRLFPAGLRRARHEAGDTDDAILLAEQVEGLDGLFGEADNSFRRKHRIPRARRARNGHYALSAERRARASRPAPADALLTVGAQNETGFGVSRPVQTPGVQSGVGDLLSIAGAALSLNCCRPDVSEGYRRSRCRAWPRLSQPNDRDRRASPKVAPSSGLQRINVEERRLSPGLSTSSSIHTRSTPHRRNGGASEQTPLEDRSFGSLSKTASSVAREPSARSAAGSRRVFDPDLVPITRPLGCDL